MTLFMVHRQDIKVEDGYIYIGNDKAIKLKMKENLFYKLDFASYGADVVLECTGAF